jgi:GT2 family glycosyltransferase
VGGFDENFFMYFDETDLSWRARIAGLRIVCCPDAVVRHKIDPERAYNTRSRYYIDRNSLLSSAKNYAFHNMIFFLPISLGVRVAGIFVLTLLGRVEYARSTARAICDFFVHLPTVWEKRHAVQATRRLTDQEVLDEKVLASPRHVLRAFSSSLLPSTAKRGKDAR